MRKVITASDTAKERKAIKANSGSIEEMLDAFEGRISQLENFDDLNMTTDIYEDEEDIEECGDVYSSEEILSDVEYYETDARNLMSEEDMYAEIVGAILGVIEQSGGTVEDAAKDCREWFNWLIDQAVTDIESGNAKSVYDR